MTVGSFATARTTDLIVQEMGEETLVFDRRTDVAHCLTPAAATVWQMCDGATSRDAMVAAIAEIAPLNAEATVEAALVDLSEKDLLVSGVSRRVALGKMAKYGVGAVTVPLVLSVTAPLALAGQSNPRGTVCTQTPASSGLNPDCLGGACGQPPARSTSTPASSTSSYCGACFPAAAGTSSGARDAVTVTNCGTDNDNDNEGATRSSTSCCSGSCRRRGNASTGTNRGYCV